MKITSLLIVLLLSCLTAFAGTLSGDVKTTGQSAVVLETVPAKAFPAPKQSAAMDQRSYPPAHKIHATAPVTVWCSWSHPKRKPLSVHAAK